MVVLIWTQNGVELKINDILHVYQYYFLLSSTCYTSIVVCTDSTYLKCLLSSLIIYWVESLLLSAQVDLISQCAPTTMVPFTMYIIISVVFWFLKKFCLSSVCCVLIPKKVLTIFFLLRSDSSKSFGYLLLEGTCQKIRASSCSFSLIHWVQIFAIPISKT